MKTVKSLACPICGEPIQHQAGIDFCRKCSRQYTKQEMKKFKMKDFPLSKFTCTERTFERSA